MTALFNKTDVMTKMNPTKEMGKYLVLSMDFSFDYILWRFKDQFLQVHQRVRARFLDKYVKAGLLDNPINIHPTSADLCKICSRKSRSQAVRYTSSWTSAIFVEPVSPSFLLFITIVITLSGPAIVIKL
jgi:hypothetical protein